MVRPKKMLIAPMDIKTWYYDEISVPTAYKRLNALQRLGYDRCWLVVEKVGFQQYVLLEGYREYSAFIALQPDVAIPCLVVENERKSSEQELIIKILRKAVPLETTSWNFKNAHVRELMNKYGMEIKEIVRLIGQDASQVKSWTHNTRIPVHIQHLAYENRATKMVDNICKSINIHEELKPYLYERAVKPKGHQDRLKPIDLELFVSFCKTIPIPRPLLQNAADAEHLVDKVLRTRWMIPDFWQQLLPEWFPHYFPRHSSPQDADSPENFLH
ncbi:hypothetical protein [Anoxybacteroides tepidamans]|uniref:hypothetical protein n=1 Tax=Anoxybacteroides tepidamans TaxID=265948 RepID=UPI00048A3EED|nr:hypothetical protein [Anoxybacillus tepidamans]